VRHCAGQPCLSAPDAAATSLPPLPPTPRHWPPGPAVARSRLSAAHVESTAPRRPPLSCHSAATCARWPGATVGRSVLPTATLGPSPLLLLPPCGTEPTPLLSLVAPRTERSQKPPAADLTPLLLHFSSPSAPRAAASPNEQFYTVGLTKLSLVQ
jgi:hypothetical protein